MKRMLPILLIVFAPCFASCRNDIVYSQFSSIPSGEWHVDSVAQFEYSIVNPESDYRMLVYLRHTESYPYQNMWLFVDNGLNIDTIEFYLADDRGQWLGDKHHGFVEMPVLLEENYHFPDSGRYSITIQQGMRDTLLRGVTDIGLEIIRNGQK